MRVTLGELVGKLPFKQGPRNRLRRAAGAAAPAGLTTAAPNLPAQVWTGGRANASGVGTSRALREASNRGGS